MKKIALIFLILLLASLASASDFALIVKTSPSQNILNILDNSGYSYGIISDSQVPSANFSGYAALLIQDSITNKNYLPISSKNTIFLDKNLVKTIFGSSWASYSTSNIFSKIKTLNSPFTDSLSTGTFIAYSQSKEQYYIKRATSGSSLPVYGIAYPTGTSSQLYPIIAYSNSTKRYVFFGFINTGYWTENTKKLFENSLSWARKGIDFDNDGFYTDEDCNDNNAGISPNALEIPYNYLDENCDGYDSADLDSDGYCKKGYLIQNRLVQCINEYRSTGADCNDDDENISPEAAEITDSIDQNCRNDNPIFAGNISDITISEDESFSINLAPYFTDPEGDNLTFSKILYDSNINIEFNKSTAIISPKKDWNGDSNFTFVALDNNGGAMTSNRINLLVLPVNDAPVMQDIPEIKIPAGSLVRIAINASDADKDNLTYSSNDSRFSQNGNVFEWQTSYNDAGTYFASFSASDGIFSVSKIAKITLYPKLVINEIMPYPYSGSEWVEIYNPGSGSISLTGCYLEDSSYSHIQLHGSISGNSFLVSEFSNTLDNSGDTVKLKCPELIDRITYSAVSQGKSYGRISDSYDTDNNSDWKIYDLPTKGISNSADVLVPAVALISPENNSVFTSGNVLFNFTASDNSQNLTCYLYSDIMNKTFKSLASQPISSNSQANFYASDIENGNYSWQVKCSDGINLGASEARFFRINSPKAPVLQQIPEINIQETEIARVVLNASDENEDMLTYSSNDSRFSQNGNVFEWQTSYNDAGTYYAGFSASDGIFSVSKIARITVTKLNRAPILEGIEPVTINEDEAKEITLNATDPDNDSLSFSVKSHDAGKAKCSINGNILKIEPAKDWNGDSSCEIEVSDGKLPDSKQVLIHVIPVNDAPEIGSFSPERNIFISKRASQEFSISSHDIDSQPEIKWYVNNELSETGNSYTFQKPEGSYAVKAVVSDSEYSAEKEWSAIVVKSPIVSKYNGNTTDFSEITDSDLESVRLTLEKSGTGKIDFLEPADLRYVADIDSNSEIQAGFAAMDTLSLPQLAGKLARISFYNLAFEKIPSVYYDENFNLDRASITQICPSSICQNITYENHVLSFISHFSSFRIGDALTCSQQRGEICSSSEVCSGSFISALEDNCCSSSCMPKFSKINKCENTSSDFTLEIRKPEEDETFSIGETINAKIRLENELSKTLRPEIELSLYDLTSDSVIDDYSKKISLKKESRADAEFSVELDSSLDDSHDYALFAIAEDDDFCSQNFVKFSVERKEHDIKITRFDIPDTANCGESFPVSLSVENQGYEDEDVSLELSNSALGIGEEVTFILDSANKKTKNYELFIPDYAEEGDYSVSAKAEFSGRSETLIRKIFIKCAAPETSVSQIPKAIVSQEEIKEKSLAQKINEISSIDLTVIIIDIFLALGILFLILYLLLRR